MNLRALTRGDAAVAGAAVLLFIASFLPYSTFDACSGVKSSSCFSASQNAWNTGLFPILPSVFLLGLAAAALILVQRFQGPAAATRQVLGLRLDQWGIAFAVAALWTGVWALGGGGDSSAYGHGFGAWLAVLALIVLAGAAAAGPLVPALQAPLVTDKPAVQPGYPGAAGYPAPGVAQGQPQPGQYGYPVPGQEAAQPPAYGQPQQGGYGYPAPGQPQDASLGGQPAQPQPVQAQPAPAAPAADFAPFWFAVPEQRQLAPKDNPHGGPVGELVPGTWYLAVEQRGAALVAQLQDGSQGVLNDTSGIQRG
ncbi:hypothetical protein GCM10010495_15780 [Kitasatospora herbaricolor]|uniref:hypothetical protein n=1 Tax=Kitasatospora herbaricolor TaxID=68217 RepID=UPI00174C6476|nr:hypothetical protein [Kitasatospora herbaricolor]MDQ0308037.1 hypothetical protein [Kitasatospora herbaricolor]GGV05050.1 hypothetical protein GCM10010495_15780 [Kitasatospora herbaricolor]